MRHTPKAYRERERTTMWNELVQDDGHRIGVGFAGAYGLANVIASLLHGVEPSDPATFAGVSVLLLAIAAVAGYLPARRASRIDPVRALTI